MKKKKNGYPLRWRKGEPSKFEGKGGWLPPQNILSCHFDKYLHGMVLKLSGHVRNTVSLLYKQKSGWNSDFWNFFSEKMDFFFQFWFTFTENPLFESGHVWKRHCDIIRWPIFMILVSMERGDPTLYHGTKQSYFGPVNFKLPLVNHVTKKGLVGQGLNQKHHANMYCSIWNCMSIPDTSFSWYPIFHPVRTQQTRNSTFNFLDASCSTPFSLSFSERLFNKLPFINIYSMVFVMYG